MQQKQQSFLIIISGPSAVGKTSVAEIICKTHSDIKRIVTFTTRLRRENEINNIDYNFISLENFEDLKKNNELIEFSQIYNNYYGIGYKSLIEQININKKTIAVIDGQGFLKIRAAKLNNNIKIISIFLYPPSIDELEKRIRNRAQNKEEDILFRLKMAKNDMNFASEFDFCIENNSLEQTVIEVMDVINENYQ